MSPAKLDLGLGLFVVLLAVCPVISGTNPFEKQQATLALLNQRISSLSRQIPEALDQAAFSISSETAKKNRKQLTYGIAITLAAIFTIQSGLEGRDLKNLTPAEIYLHLATATNGYSFGFIYIFEGQLADPRLQCGSLDFLDTLNTYSSIASDNSNVIHQLIELPEHENPYDILNSASLPTYASYQVSRLDEDLQNALLCILSNSGSSTEAFTVSQLIQNLLETLRQRLNIFSTILDTKYQTHLESLSTPY